MDGFVVKAIRTSLGLTQKEFANELGVRQQRISEIETGKKPISKRLENRIVYRFNLSDSEIEVLKSLKKFKSVSDGDDRQ